MGQRVVRAFRLWKEERKKKFLSCHTVNTAWHLNISDLVAGDMICITTLVIIISFFNQFHFFSILNTFWICEERTAAPSNSALQCFENTHISVNLTKPPSLITFYNHMYNYFYFIKITKEVTPPGITDIKTSMALIKSDGFIV